MRAKTVAAVVVAALLMVAGYSGTRWLDAGASDGNGMDLMAIDMDPSSNPANTNASIGSIETCARMNENNIQDADEDAVDRLIIDVVADNVPVGSEMLGFSFELAFPASSVFVQSGDFINFMVNRIDGSSPTSASDPLPDMDGTWIGGALDTGQGPVHESGDGTLMRVTLESTSTPTAGVHDLTLSANAHLDPQSGTPQPDETQNATVAINTACSGGSTPTPTPFGQTPTPSPTPTPFGQTPTPSPTPTPFGQTPTPSPTPTPFGQTPSATPTPTPFGQTPTPAPTATPSGTPGPVVKGDLDCDGDVDAVDALKVLQYVAGFPVVLPAGCPPIGLETADMDCDGDVDAVDALSILRFVAGFPVVLPLGCAPFGL